MNRISGKRQCLEVFYVHLVHPVNPVYVALLLPAYFCSLKLSLSFWLKFPQFQSGVRPVFPPAVPVTKDKSSS